MMLKPEILVLGRLASDPIMEQMEAYYHCHHAWRVDASRQDEFIRGIGGNVRAVVTTGVIGIDAERIRLLPRLEIIAVNGIGVDAVALDVAHARGIAVTSTPGVLTEDVADLAVLLLLAAARRLPALDRYVRSGQWQRRVPLQATLSLRGKVAGIFGLGRIGCAVARRLQAFGMELRYYQPRALPDTSLPRAESLLALAAESDYLIVCAPATPHTRHAVDTAVLAALGPQGTLVNIARGALVDEPALIAALREGRLGAAALDVFADEPHVPPALCALDNVVLTPHVASLTVETRQAMGQLVLDNLSAHFSGLPLPTPVR